MFITFFGFNTFHSRLNNNEHPIFPSTVEAVFSKGENIAFFEL